MTDSLLRGDPAAWAVAALIGLACLLLALRVLSRRHGRRRPIDMRRHEEALRNFRLRHGPLAPQRRWGR
jgi:hypothetical protein